MVLPVIAGSGRVDVGMYDDHMSYRPGLSCLSPQESSCS